MPEREESDLLHVNIVASGPPDLQDQLDLLDPQDLFDPFHYATVGDVRRSRSHNNAAARKITPTSSPNAVAKPP